MVQRGGGAASLNKGSVVLHRELRCEGAHLNSRGDIRVRSTRVDGLRSAVVPEREVRKGELIIPGIADPHRRRSMRFPFSRNPEWPRTADRSPIIPFEFTIRNRRIFSIHHERRAIAVPHLQIVDQKICSGWGEIVLCVFRAPERQCVGRRNVP